MEREVIIFTWKNDAYISLDTKRFIQGFRTLVERHGFPVTINKGRPRVYSFFDPIYKEYSRKRVEEIK
jgi:type II secretory pathway component HofQ